MRARLFQQFIPAILWLLTTALAGQTAWGRPPAPWPGPQGDYLFVDADQFKPQGAGWQIEPTPPGIYNVIASRMKLISGSGAGTGTADFHAQVDAAGKYVIWVRYAQVPGMEPKVRGPFTLTIKQGEKAAFAGTFDENGDATTTGGNAVQAPLRWEKRTATLAQGPAVLSLSKSGPATVAARARKVDCVLLTTDAKYEPDDRDFAPQTYLRIKLASATPEKVYFYMFLDHLRAPWYQNIFMDKAGLGPAGSVAGAESEYLTHGDSTPWMNISRLLYIDSNTLASLHATVRYHNPDAAKSDYTLQFATAPTESAIVQSIHRHGPGNGIQMVLPPDLTEGRRPKSDAEFAQETAATLAKFPPIKFGHRPTKFPLIVDIPASTANNSPEVRDLEFTAATYLGNSGLVGSLTAADVAAGLKFSVSGADIWRMGPAGYNEPLLDKLDASAKNGAEELAKGPHHGEIAQFILMDEAGAKDLESMATNPTDQKAFIAWLHDEGRTPQDLGVTSWEQIKLTADRAAKPPELYYFSQRFRAWSVANFFRLATAAVHKHYPPSIRTTQNYSDGAVYMANFYMQGNDYFTWFKDGVLDAATSEDWTNNGATPELTGWNVALLRAATKYHHQPIQMYDITSYGRTPLDVKLKGYTDISQGAKFLNFYAYSPSYAGHEGGWYHHWVSYPGVAELCHEVGAAEDILIDAMPRQAQTAIIYSIPADIWSSGVDNAQGCERMFTYLALRHAQVPVDVLSDEDARGEYLGHYKVAYLFGNQLDTRNVAPLAAWVKAGGTLVLSPGAGSRDQLSRPTDALDKALGLSRSPVQIVQGYDNASYFLPVSLSPKGEVHLRRSNDSQSDTVPLLAQRQGLQGGSGNVVATFADGSPAAVTTTLEKGRVVQVGFMPGLDYVYEALVHQAKNAKDQKVAPMATVAQVLSVTDRAYAHTPPESIYVPRPEYSACPAHYRAEVRDFITEPTRRAKVDLPVQVSQPQVEATLMEGKQGWVVPLANYTGQRLDSIIVTIKPGRACGEVHSSRLGAIKSERNGNGSIRLTLPLESTDMIFAEWAKE